MLLWCVAIIAHFDDRMHQPLVAANVTCMVVAVTALFFARSTYVMLAVALLQIAACWATMPNIDNHWFFCMFISATIAVVLVAQVLRDRGVPRTIPADAIEVMAPPIRMLVISMYLLAVFHKLNTDFFNPEISCAIDFYRRAIRNESWLPLPLNPSRGLRELIISGVVLLEFLPAMFLLWRRTWFVGLVCGVAFHLSTGLFMRHFPTIMFCLYAWFVPADVFHRVVSAWEAWLRKMTRGRIGIVGAVQIATLLWAAWTLIILVDRYPQRPQMHSLQISAYRALLRSWDVVALVSFLAFAAVVVRAKDYRRFEPHPLWNRAWPLYGIVILFAANGLSPYLGLKDHPCMVMWSNLYMKNGHSNHILVPAGALTVFPYMDDMVEIRATNVPRWHNRYVRGNRLISFTNLRGMIQQQQGRPGSPIYLRYVRGGVEHETFDAELDDAFSKVSPYLFRKWNLIKDGTKDNHGRCSS